MSAEESFLRRWSRRKREAAAGAAGARPEADSERQEPAAAAPPPVRPLPPIETIDAASNVAAFLAPGVPLALARDALRRAWVSDPAIRDFVGLAENAWDFNTPGGVPGFGALDPEDGRRLLARLLGAEDSTEESADAAPAPVADAPPPRPVASGGAAAPGDDASTPVPPAEQPNQDSAANPRDTRGRRRHGSALPG